MQACSQARRPGRPQIITGRYFCLGPGADGIADRYIRHYYGAGCSDHARADTLTSREQLHAELRRLAEAGCDEVLLFPCSGGLGQLARLADALGISDTTPALHARAVPSDRKRGKPVTHDLPAAREFMARHARILDRRRFELLRRTGDPIATIAALDAYRNPDGGYGWGLEPDLRSPESQPGAAHHAFEVFENLAPMTVPQAAALCDWLGSVTLTDGGLRFALPLTTTAGSGPWWTAADASSSSLQITAVTAAAAHRVAAHDPAVAAHSWLERATGYCLRAIEQIEEPPFAYVLAFSVRFLDALYTTRPEPAAAALEHLRRFVPADGRLPVRGGTEHEMLHPLDLAPYPNGLARQLFSDEVISTDLTRLAAGQREDGGWTVDYLEISPAGSMDWRGYATVRAIDILTQNTPAPTVPRT